MSGIRCIPVWRLVRQGSKKGICTPKESQDETLREAGIPSHLSHDHPYQKRPDHPQAQRQALHHLGEGLALSVGLGTFVSSPSDAFALGKEAFAVALHDEPEPRTDSVGRQASLLDQLVQRGLRASQQSARLLPVEAPVAVIFHLQLLPELPDAFDVGLPAIPAHLPAEQLPSPDGLALVAVDRLRAGHSAASAGDNCPALFVAFN